MRIHSSRIALALLLVGCGSAPPPAPPLRPAVNIAPAPPSSAGPEAQEERPAASPERILAALEKANSDEWSKLLDELVERFGGPGLVQALDVVVDRAPPEKAFFQTAHLMRLLRELADPRAADPLVRWLEAKPRWMHWQGEAGIVLATVGDVRGAKYLAARLKVDPQTLYNEEHFWEADEGGHLSRTDLPRVVAARLLADLAVMHPDKADELKTAAEDAVLGWAKDGSVPHANALRFLAAVGSQKALGHLRAWAFPKKPLPSRGAQPPFPVEMEMAQMGLRYIGLIRDEPSFPKLLAQLQRKTDKKLDITQDALSSGNAMLGMALRALGHGASQGLAHFADPRAQGPLVAFIEDETWHEEARLAACEALAWCADDATRASLIGKIKAQLSRKTPGADFIASCYGDVFVMRRVAANASDLVDLLAKGIPAGVRGQAARALAGIALDRPAQARLEAKLGEKELRADAALALLLGGSGPVARLLGAIDGFDAAEKEELQRRVQHATGGFLADDDPGHARLIRWERRAGEAAAVTSGGKAQTWVREALVAGLRNVMYDNGPHSVTRPVLRHQLLRQAQTDAANRRGAIGVLALLEERGVLMALAAQPNETAEMARRALGTMTKR